MDKDVPVSVWPEWELIEKIGEGSFGKVYKAKRTERHIVELSAQSVLLSISDRRLKCTVRH